MTEGGGVLKLAGAWSAGPWRCIIDMLRCLQSFQALRRCRAPPRWTRS